MASPDVVIVEDEPVVARRLGRLLRQIAPGVTVLVYATLAEARAGLAESGADVLLLDLNLRGQDGFELLAEAAASPAETIVVSANTDRALEAFAFGVADFVPKPFDADRLALALSRVRDGARREPAKLLSVRHVGALEVIPIDDIEAVHGAGDYSELELVDGRRRCHEKTLRQLEHLLEGAFMRIHKSHIVRLEAVAGLRAEPGSRYFVRLRGGEEFPVSRQRIKALRERLGETR